MESSRDACILLPGPPSAEMPSGARLPGRRAFTSTASMAISFVRSAKLSEVVTVLLSARWLLCMAAVQRPGGQGRTVTLQTRKWGPALLLRKHCCTQVLSLVKAQMQGKLSDLEALTLAVFSALTVLLTTVIQYWLMPGLEQRKAKVMAQAQFLIDHNKARAQAYQALFEVAGGMCSPVYAASGPMLTIRQFKDYLQAFSDCLNKYGNSLDPSSRACAILVRERGGNVLRANWKQGGINWSHTRKLWAAKSLLRSILNYMTHRFQVDTSKLEGEKWLTSNVDVSQFRGNIIENLRLLDLYRGSQGNEDQPEIVDKLLEELHNYLKEEKTAWSEARGK